MIEGDPHRVASKVVRTLARKVIMTPASTDSDLWHLACLGSTEAFEVIVKRHQSVVSAVAYSTCGDLELSEDVAQETFWTAWRGRTSLQDPARLRPWLCGIARNLGRNAGRRASRPAESAATLETVPEPSSDAPEPSDEAVTREEASLVWESLAAIPETYREPLILFYREDRSVADVAAALDLSEDAVKQRLSRGRGMLRERVAELVEDGLRRSRPGRNFTVCVMAGLAAGSAGAKTALAAGGAGGAAAAASAVAGGVAGGMLGSLVGLGGGWLGTWIPAQLAESKNEREIIFRAGRRILVVSLVFIALLVGLIYSLAGRTVYLIGWGLWFIAFQAYVWVEALRLAQSVKRIRANVRDSEPNDAPLRTGMMKIVTRFRGRVYRSRAQFLGLPLIDINVRDPISFTDNRLPESSNGMLGVARGWIAVGDDAYGIVLAVGSKARGIIAVGGRAIGVVSFGGLAVGLVSVGGAAVGVLGIGGFGLGVYAFGGLALGWQALGGGAIGWNAACGGLAVAWHAAIGGAAFARDYALGGGGSALHFNDAAARDLLSQHLLNRVMNWYIARNTWVTTAVVLMAVLISFAPLRIMYQRERGQKRPGLEV
jgi:zinc protease